MTQLVSLYRKCEFWVKSGGNGTGLQMSTKNICINTLICTYLFCVEAQLLRLFDPGFDPANQESSESNRVCQEYCFLLVPCGRISTVRKVDHCG